MREMAQAKATEQYPSPSRHSGQSATQPLKDSSSAVGRQITAGKKLSGPVVIWNLIRRCNLTCKHCYAQSADHEYAGELSTEEVFTVMDDLKQFGVPVLILIWATIHFKIVQASQE